MSSPLDAESPSMSSQPPAQMHQVSLPYSSTTLSPPSFPTPGRSGSSIISDSLLEDSPTTASHVCGCTGNSGKESSQSTNQCRCQVIPFDMFPDEVLLAIFDFCAHEDSTTKSEIEAWQSLVHVCRRWRSVVFGSPRRLNLRLYCTTRTLVTDTLDVWPALPLLIRDDGYTFSEGVDNIIAALKRSDRVCEIILDHAPTWYLEEISAAMQGPFPELTNLVLRSYDMNTEEPVLPDSLLGGSVPCLRSIRLHRVSFPGLPRLLLSAPHLVNICLTSIPHSGYISPEAMLIALSTLTSLESLEVQFPRSLPDRENRLPPPPARSVLPVLTSFRFKGVSDYLEDLVAHLNTPRLSSMRISFLNQTAFHTPQFIRFISRTPRLKGLENAYVTFNFKDDTALVAFSSQTFDRGIFKVKIICEDLDGHVFLERVLTSSLGLFSAVENLYIFKPTYWKEDRRDNIENMLLPNLLHRFAFVKNLYLSEEFAPSVASALQVFVGGRITEVLPILQNIFLEELQSSEPIQEGIREFVANRQVTGHLIVVSRWYR